VASSDRLTKLSTKGTILKNVDIKHNYKEVSVVQLCVEVEKKGNPA
jgi:hypothetical protein